MDDFLKPRNERFKINWHGMRNDSGNVINVVLLYQLSERELTYNFEAEMFLQIPSSVLV